MDQRYRRCCACLLAVLVTAVSGCRRQERAETPREQTPREQTPREQTLSGRLHIDGSSTLYPVTDAAARRFMKDHPGVWIRLDLSGSGRGLRKLCDGAIPVANASRCIKPDEVAAAKRNGLDILELPVAFDGLAVVVNRENDWVDALTVKELKQLWRRGSSIGKWSDLRPEWPSTPVLAAAPTPESGTFAYFTTVICGEEGSIREGYFAHEDEHVTGPYLAERPGAIGFMGFGWYRRFSDRLRPVAIRVDGETVLPGPETITSGAYAPLARPLFVYTTRQALARPEVERFLQYYLAHAPELVTAADYIAFPEEAYGAIQERLRRRRTGSAFPTGIRARVGLDDLLQLPR